MTRQELEEQLRAIKHYRWNGKDIIAELHVTVAELANGVFQKLSKRGMTIALASGATWCEDCPKLYCWDRGKAIHCNEKGR